MPRNDCSRSDLSAFGKPSRAHFAMKTPTSRKPVGRTHCPRRVSPGRGEGRGSATGWWIHALRALPLRRLPCLQPSSASVARPAGITPTGFGCCAAGWICCSVGVPAPTRQLPTTLACRGGSPPLEAAELFNSERQSLAARRATLRGEQSSLQGEVNALGDLARTRPAHAPVQAP